MDCVLVVVYQPQEVLLLSETLLKAAVTSPGYSVCG